MDNYKNNTSITVICLWIIIILLLAFIYFYNQKLNNNTENFINYKYGSGMPGYEILPSGEIIRQSLYKGNIYKGLDYNVTPTQTFYQDNKDNKDNKL